MDSDSGTFLNVPSDLKIYVRVDYPYSTVGGRSVTKVLPPLIRKLNTCKVRASQRLSLGVFAVIAYFTKI